MQRLRKGGIYCSPGVTIEFQQATKRHVLRGRESGGAIKEFGHYVSFCGEGGERLPWFVRPDSLTANGDHAIVIAPALVSIEALRIEHTYELLIVRHELRAEREGARPRIWSRLVFRGWQGQLPLDLVDKDRSVAGQIAPEFFTRAGEPRQLPAQFVEAVHAIVVGVNCRNCSHAHLLVAPTRGGGARHRRFRLVRRKLSKTKTPTPDPRRTRPWRVRRSEVSVHRSRGLRRKGGRTVGFISRVVTTGLVALAAGGSYHLLTERRLAPSSTAGAGNPGSSSTESERFAPAENLERIEIGELRAAAQRLRGSRIPLNIAMYAFTDRAIAQLLIEESDAGTVIRVYRDGEQYEEEERQHYGIGSVTSMFRGHANIHVRVKPASRSDLMHLKCWSDGRVLRDGSANWSPAGLKRQDNEIRYTTDGHEVQEFNQNFEQLWNRPTNTRVQ